MSSFLSNKFLRYRVLASKNSASPSGSFHIEHDLLCPGCGYNLRGLNYGRNCPECARQIEREEHIDALATGDWAQRQRILLALTCLSCSLFYAALARAGVFVSLVFLGWSVAAWMYVWGGLFASVAWIAGVWIMTDHRIVPHFAGVSMLRIATRMLNLLWLPGYALWIWTLKLGTPWFAGPMATSSFVNIILRAGACLGVFGMAVILLRLAVLADLEDAARRIYRSLWLLPIATILLALMPSVVPWVALLPIIIFLIAWCWCVMLLGRGVWAMAQHVGWTMRLTADRTARTTRLQQTRQEIDAEVAAQVRSLPQPQGEIPFDQ